ncbi:MAG: SH3 domain-containing protein, partial [Bacillota bacterium]|nr:SH3 domain-containing protein [Bacillota bacterium]
MSTEAKRKRSRISAIIVATMMFFTTFAVIPNTDLGKSYAAGETGQVTASSLNVRSGAGTGYSKIGSLSKGKTFTVTGTAKDKSGVKWYKLKYNSKTGYVSSKYVNIKQPTVTSVSNLKGTVNTKSDPLTVRSGAGSGYSKIGSLAKGKTFTITGKAQDSSGKWWYRLTYSGKNGYVSSSYVKTTSTSSSATTVTSTTGTVNTKSDPLTVRSGPGTSYSKLGTIANGKTFSITSKAKDSSGVWWYKFKFNGKNGYVSSKY